MRDFANHVMGGQGGRIRQPHLMLEVSRDNIVHDTVHQIERIIFNESNGVGALRKELFQNRAFGDFYTFYTLFFIFLVRKYENNEL